MSEKAEKDKNLFNQILIGGLLTFGTLDTVDVHLLLKCMVEEGVISNTNLKWYYTSTNDHRRISITESGKYSLAIFFSSTEDKLWEECDKNIRKFYRELNVEQFERRKRDFVLYETNEILRSANVLLLSDEEEEYREVKKLGFQNIDWFTSAIRADKQFRKDPSFLDRYHIVISGHQAVAERMFLADIIINEAIAGRGLAKKMLVADIYSFEQNGTTLYKTQLLGFDGAPNRTVNSHLYADILNETCISAALGNILGKVPVSDKFVPYEMADAYSKPLPTKKSDLRILFLALEMDDLALEAQKYGLDVMVAEADNLSIDRVVKDHLGDYDIIIGAVNYTALLTKLAKEASEQCKDTGRQLVLLATYYELPNTVYFRYVFAGSKESGTNEPMDLYLDVLNNSCNDSSAIKMQLLEAAVNVYEEKMIEYDACLADNDLRNAEALQRDYEAEKQLYYEDKITNGEFIEDFDKFTRATKKLLYSAKRGHFESDGILVKKVKSGARIEYFYNRKVMCAMTVSFEQGTDELRIFYLEMRGKKDKMEAPVQRGFYTSSFDGLPSTPKRPSEDEMAVIRGLYKKVSGLYVELKNKKKNKGMSLQPKKNSKK